MNMRSLLAISAALLTLLPATLWAEEGVGSGGASTGDTAAAALATDTAALDQVLQQAAQANRFVYITFTDGTDETVQAPTQAMAQTCKTFCQTKKGRAEARIYDRNAEAAQAIVARYGLAQAPMPLMLVIAPNGAVTGGIPQRVTPQQLEMAFVSRGNMETMKNLQKGQLVFVAVRGKATTGNAEADAGLAQFGKIAGFAPTIVTIDPADGEEGFFLGQLQVDPKTKQAVTLMLAPPGNLIQRFDGGFTGQQVVQAIQQARGGGCTDPGCGDASCGSKKAK